MLLSVAPDPASAAGGTSCHPAAAPLSRRNREPGAATSSTPAVPVIRWAAPRAARCPVGPPGGPSTASPVISSPRTPFSKPT